MRLVCFRDASGRYVHGVIQGDSIQPIQGDIFGGWEPQGALLKLEDVNLRAPVQPGKIIGIATNYPGATGREDGMDEPLVFLKPGSSVIGVGEDIVNPFTDVNVWGESELAIVIGQRLSSGSAEQAVSAIFGYTVANDVSCDNVFGWDHHLARSKAADTFCVLGPWIDTDYTPGSRQIESYHNGELLRHGQLDNRLFKEPDLVVWLSGWMTLEPGDVILTGAPTRVRDRQFLVDGDEFECRVEGLGSFSNNYRSATQ